MAAETFHAKRGHEARALFDQGLGCNAIAKALGVRPATISRWAVAEGVEFDRFATEAAVKAHTVDLAAARIRLAEKMLAASETMLDQIDDEYLVYNFGGKDNDYNEHTLTSAPVEVKRSIVVTAGIAFDKLTRIIERDSGGLEQAVGVLDQLAAGFEAAAREIRQVDVTPDEA